ncbi:hypothetical protein DICPUDRAFT_99631, partial [Dictyostelium purpureum]
MKGNKPEAYDLFLYLDSLSIGSLQSILKCNNPTHYYFEKLLPLIKLIDHLSNMDKSISELFYERMRFKSELFDSSKIKHYSEIIQFIKKYQEYLPVEKRKTILEFFDKLIKHWTTYTIDIDSSLIGLAPNDGTVSKLAQDIELLKVNSSKEMAQIMKEEDFIKNMLKWSSFENPIELMKQIRHYSSLFRGVDKLKKGDIIVVRFTTLTQVSPSSSSSSSGSSSSLNNSNAIPVSGSLSSLPFMVIASGSPSILGNSNSSISPSSSSTGIITSNSTFSSIQARSLFSKTKIIPNRFSSSYKKSISNIPIITLEEYYKNCIRLPPHISQQINSSGIGSGPGGAYKDTSHGSFGIGKNFQPKAQFARFSGEKAGNFFLCYFSSQETEAVAVAPENILILNKRLIEKIKENDKLYLRKLIHQPSDEFTRELVLKGKESTVGYLNQINVDLKFVQFESLNTPNLLALKKIRIMKSKVQSILSENSHPLYRELDIQVKNEISQFLTHMNESQMFMPTYGNTLNDLNENHSLSMAKSKMNQIYGEIEMALDKFEFEKLQYLNANRKNEITEWWLKTIESKCLDFLEKRYFKPSAIPDNYIEQAPNNIFDIFENLKIIKLVLSPSENQKQVLLQMMEEQQQQEVIAATNNINSNGQGLRKRSNTPQLQQPQKETLNFSPVELIEQLKSEIYPIIDDFIKRSHAVFCDILNVDNLNDNNSIKDLLNERKPSMKSNLFSQLEDLLSDLEYLEEMKRLEANPEATSFHIVPISGLVIGFFARIENELKTIIELYSPDGQYILKLNGPIPKQPQEIVQDNSFVELSLNDNNNTKANASNIKNSNIIIGHRVAQHSYSESDSPLTLTINKVGAQNRPSSPTNNINNNNNANNNSSLPTIEEKSALIESIKSTDPTLVEETIKNLMVENDDNLSDIINELDNDGWTPLHIAC